jgi:hypothetical protein
LERGVRLVTKCGKRKVQVNFMPKPSDVIYGRPLWSGMNRQKMLEDDVEESKTWKPPLHPLSGGTSDLDRKMKLRLTAYRGYKYYE